jgi:hypothetical protein
MDLFAKDQRDQATCNQSVFSSVATRPIFFKQMEPIFLSAMDHLKRDTRARAQELKERSKLQPLTQSASRFWSQMKQLSSDDRLHEFTLLLEQHKHQRIVDENFAYAIPASERIDFLKPFIREKVVLSLECGKALWEYLLKFHCRCMIATDVQCSSRRFMVIHQMHSTDALEKYGYAEVLFLCWPSMELLASDSMKYFQGDTIIFIGDISISGWPFYVLLEHHWNLVKKMPISDYYGVYDGIYVYKRKKL